MIRCCVKECDKKLGFFDLDDHWRGRYESTVNAQPKPKGNAFKNLVLHDRPVDKRRKSLICPHHHSIMLHKIFKDVVKIDEDARFRDLGESLMQLCAAREAADAARSSDEEMSINSSSLLAASSNQSFSDDESEGSESSSDNESEGNESSSDDNMQIENDSIVTPIGLE